MMTPLKEGYNWPSEAEGAILGHLQSTLHFQRRKASMFRANDSHLQWGLFDTFQELPGKL